MKTVGMFTSLALALIACSIGAGPANAQGFTGKFTLPYEAHWGVATLPAGEYSFSLERALPSGKLYITRGTEAVALILPLTIRRDKYEDTVLVVTRGTRSNEIRELRMASLGVSLLYSAPKSKRDAATDERRTTALIPVMVAGGSH